LPKTKFYSSNALTAFQGVNDNNKMQKIIKIPSRVDQIKPVRDEIIKQMAEFGFIEDSRMTIAMALDESLTNAINHGNKNDPQLTVEVIYSITSEKIEIKVRDQGKGFDWKNNRRLSGEGGFTGLEVEGRGLFLMNDLLSDIHYNDAGNEVTMVMRATGKKI